MKSFLGFVAALLCFASTLWAQNFGERQNIVLNAGIVICNSDTLEFEKGCSDVYSLYARKWNIEPYYADNELRFQFLDSCRVNYVLEFDLTPSQLSYPVAELSFECSDTYHSVWVNKKAVKKKRNNVLLFQEDIKALLKEGKNEIRIEIEPTKQQFDTVVSHNNGILTSEPRAVFRKAAYQFGWDWATRQLGGEVFLPVKIALRNDNHIIRDCAVQTLKASKQKADLIISLAVRENSKAVSKARIRCVDSHNRSFTSPMLPLKDTKRLNDDLLLEYAFSIERPELWFPHTMGSQPLYNAVVTLFDENGKAIDSAQTRFGVRQIELVRQKDSIGESYYFVCNGRKLFAKGANLVPTAMHGERYESLAEYIDLVRDCNMNMLRVWGGGFYLDDQSLEACDENGILIWQDFPFACALYPSDREYLAGVEYDAAYNTFRTVSHPCIALYCGNNEVFEGWENWGWKNEVKDTVEALASYNALFNTLLPETVNRIAPSVDYVHTSPLHGWGKPQSMTHGDSHYWGVWWGDSVFETYTRKVPRFMSEYGFQSPPKWERLQGFSLAPYSKANPQFAIHQKHNRGFELIDTRVRERFSKAASDEQYWHFAEITACDAYKIAIEAQRRAQPYCMGSLLWQLNEPYPALSWSIIDHKWQPKEVYHTVRKSFEPLIFSIDTYSSADSVFVYFINDSDKPQTLTYTIEIKNGRNERLFQFTQTPNQHSERLKEISKTKTEFDGWGSWKILSLAKRDIVGFDPADCYIWVEGVAEENPQKVISNYAFFVYPKQLKDPEMFFRVRDTWLKDVK